MRAVITRAHPDSDLVHECRFLPDGAENGSPFIGSCNLVAYGSTVVVSMLLLSAHPEASAREAWRAVREEALSRPEFDELWFERKSGARPGWRKYRRKERSRDHR